jgi:hypothetical protein
MERDATKRYGTIKQSPTAPSPDIFNFEDRRMRVTFWLIVTVSQIDQHKEFPLEIRRRGKLTNSGSIEIDSRYNIIDLDTIGVKLVIE